MRMFRVEYDAYAIEVGASKQPIARRTRRAKYLGPDIVIMRIGKHFRCYCRIER